MQECSFCLHWEDRQQIFLSFIIWFMILVNEASIQTGILHSNTDKALSITSTGTREVAVTLA